MPWRVATTVADIGNRFARIAVVPSKKDRESYLPEPIAHEIGLKSHKQSKEIPDNEIAEFMATLFHQSYIWVEIPIQKQ